MFRLALARMLVALGYVVMIGSAIAVPIVFVTFDPGLHYVALACGLAMLTGFGLVSVGDRLAPLAPEPGAKTAPPAAGRYAGMPVAPSRRNRKQASGEDPPPAYSSTLTAPLKSTVR